MLNEQVPMLTCRWRRPHEQIAQPALEHAIHMYLINRGVLIAPFHNMTLVCPDTTPANVDHLIATVRDCCDELRAA